MSKKSVTIKIGADTQDFLNEMKKADTQISRTQKTANYLAKSLKLNPSTTKFNAAQKQYQKALDQTEQNAEKLRQKLEELKASGRMETDDYANLEAQLAKTEARADELKNKLENLPEVDVKKLTDKLEDAGQKMDTLASKTKGVSIAATGVLAGGLALAKNAAQTGAEIDDLSQRFDVNAETIQRWQYLAMQGGVDVDVFTKSLVKMRAAVADVAAGTSNKATETLFSLGLDPSKFSSTEEMFNAITQALSNMEDKTLQAAYANELFGDKIATEMLQYINTGKEEIAKWNAEFDAMPKLTGEQVEALAELDDQFNRLKTSMKYAGAELGLAFMPIAEKVVGWIEEHFIPAIEDLAEGFEEMPEWLQDFMIGGLGVLAVGAPLLKFIGFLTSGVGKLIGVFKDFHKAQLLTVGGYAALLTAAGLFFDVIAKWGNMDAWAQVLAVFGLLTTAALGAALAIGVFHSAWSIGGAVAGIVAGIAAVTVAINSAKEDIEMPDTSSFSSTPSTSFYVDDYDVPKYGSTSNTYNESSSNDVYNVNITIEGSKLSAEEIATEVSKKIATLAQSRG